MKFLFLFFFIFQIYSEENSKKNLSLQGFFSLTEQESFQYISKLSKEETSVLITSIRSEARKEYKNIDKFYLLISHLESIKAIQEEHERLKSLNLVYIISLFIILLLLFWVIYSQKKTLSEIKNLQS